MKKVTKVIKKKPEYPKLDMKTKKVLAKFVKAARYARNFGGPNLPVEQLRIAGVEAETELEYVFGVKTANQISSMAFQL